MTEVAFYHLTRKPLERALPELLEKVLERGMRAVVLAASEERVRGLDAHLWSYDKASFLPHGAAGDANPDRQPVWLTAEADNPNAAEVLILIDGRDVEDKSAYTRCLDMFNGLDEDAVSDARARWKAARAAGHDCTYWKQGERGWERGA